MEAAAHGEEAVPQSVSACHGPAACKGDKQSVTWWVKSLMEALLGRQLA